VWHRGSPGEPVHCVGGPDSDPPSDLLLDPDDPLTERIDFVLFRDRFEPVDDRIPGSMKAEIVGDEVGDRVSDLWPSDHAGVLVGFRAPPGLLASR